MKFFIASILAAFALASAQAATQQVSITPTAGAASYQNGDSYASFSLLQIDLRGMTPVNSTTTVKKVHAGVTSTVTTVTSTDGTGQYLAPSSSTSVQWLLTNAPITAGSGAIVVPTGKVIRAVNLMSMVAAGSIVTTVVSTVGYTNTYLTTCVGGFGTLGDIAMPTVNPVTITFGTGTNVGRGWATVDAVATVYSGATTVLSPGDKLLFTGAGTNVTGASGTILGTVTP